MKKVSGGFVVGKEKKTSFLQKNGHRKKYSSQPNCVQNKQVQIPYAQGKWGIQKIFSGKKRTVNFQQTNKRQTQFSNEVFFFFF